MMRALGFHFSAEEATLLIHLYLDEKNEFTLQQVYGVMTLIEVNPITPSLDIYKYSLLINFLPHPHDLYYTPPQQEKSEKDWEHEIKASFSLFSSERNVITIKDFKRVAKEIGEAGMTEDDFQILVSETDGNGDGDIDDKDWMRVMTTIVSRDVR